MKYFLILFTCFMLIVLGYHFATAEPPIDEKKLREAFYEEDFKLTDSVIHYQLTTDSLTLNLPPNPQFSKWNLQIMVLDQRNMKNHVYLFPKEYQFVKNKLVIKDFHIEKEDVPFCEVSLVGFPVTHKWCIVKRSVLGGMNKNLTEEFDLTFINDMVFLQHDDSNTLRIRPTDILHRYVAFNIEKANTLPEEERDYCFRFMYKKLGYTDALIDGVFEEAKRNTKENQR